MAGTTRDDSRGPWEDRRILRALGALAGPAALAAFALLAVGPAVNTSHQRFRNALKNTRESEGAALSRFRTPEYAAALAKVLETIPRDAAYYIVQTDAGHGDYFVRFDLAPRRPVRLEGSPSGPPPADAPRWVVLGRLDPPGPEVFETADYFRREAPP